MHAKFSRKLSLVFAMFVSALAFATYSHFTVITASAAQESSSKVAQEKIVQRDNYYPNTEQLADDEMRVIALGTGTPNFRHSQASASWLVELGNGEKFIFDIGTGSLANLAALEIPYTYLDKIFIRLPIDMFKLNG